MRKSLSVRRWTRWSGVSIVSSARVGFITHVNTKNNDFTVVSQEHSNGHGQSKKVTHSVEEFGFSLELEVTARFFIGHVLNSLYSRLSIALTECVQYEDANPKTR